MFLQLNLVLWRHVWLFLRVFYTCFHIRGLSWLRRCWLVENVQEPSCTHVWRTHGLVDVVNVQDRATWFELLLLLCLTFLLRLLLRVWLSCWWKISSFIVPVVLSLQAEFVAASVTCRSHLLIIDKSCFIDRRTTITVPTWSLVFKFCFHTATVFS